MADKTPAQRAQEFLTGVLAHVPEDRRQAVTEALTQEALNALGQGVLRQDEFSRSKDALAREQERLNSLIARNEDWYTQAQPKLTRAQQIIDAGGGRVEDDPLLDPAEPRRPAVPVTPSLTEDTLKRVVAESEGGAVKFFGVLDSIKARHFNAFGELLDTSTLLSDPRLTQVGLPALYEEQTRDRYKAKADAEEAKKIAEAEARGKAAGIAETQAKFSQAGPYPSPHQIAQQSPTIAALQAIHQETEGDASKLAARGFKNRFDEQAAGAEYQQLVQSGVGAGQ